MPSESDTRRCVHPAKFCVPGVELQHPVDDFKREQVFLLVKQDTGVVQSRGAAIRVNLESSFEPLFCAVNLIALELDSGEQSKGLNVAAAAEHVCLQSVLSRRQLP